MKNIYAFVLIIVLAGCKYHAPIVTPEDPAEVKAAKALLAAAQPPIHITGKTYFFGDSILRALMAPV